MVVNNLCTYAPQVGCIENEKYTFWEHLDQELSATPDDESVIVGGLFITVFIIDLEKKRHRYYDRVTRQEEVLRRKSEKEV